MHVAHVIIDGGIDIPRLAEHKSRFNGGAADGMLSPDAVCHLAIGMRCLVGVCCQFAEFY